MSGIFIWAEPGDEKQKIDRESGGYVDWRNGGTASAFAVSVNTEKAFRTAWDMWAPASLIFFFLVVIVVFVLRHTMSISLLDNEINELAMQVMLLKERNEELEEKLQAETEDQRAENRK